LQASHANLPFGSPLLFIAFFAALWALICVVISFLGGWHALSRRFGAQSEAYGENRSAGPFFYGVQMRFRVGYNSVIRMTAAADALHLSVLFPFRIGHPPLCIPWTEITMHKATFLWMPFVVLTLGKQERIPMRISGRMAGKLGILEKLPDEVLPE
jgi:hypothetical protein